MKNLRLTKSWVILSLLLVALSITACKEKEELENSAEALADYKADLLSIYEKDSYSYDDMVIIGQYFQSFFEYNQKFEKIVKNRKKKRRRDDRIARNPVRRDSRRSDRTDRKFRLDPKDVQAICENIVVEKGVWDITLKKCVSGDYFLCAEEVRYFPQMMTKLMEITAQHGVSLGTSPTCSTWFR